MSAPDHDRLFDALRQGRLTAQDERELEALLLRHPEQRASLEEDLALSQLLKQLPHAPLASNFTAQVMQAVARETGRGAGASSRGWRFGLRRWLPQFSAAAAALALGLFSYHQHQLAQRRDVAKHLAEMSRLFGGASLDLLENFDAIKRLDQVPTRVDQELIAALQ